MLIYVTVINVLNKNHSNTLNKHMVRQKIRRYWYAFLWGGHFDEHHP